MLLLQAQVAGLQAEIQEQKREAAQNAARIHQTHIALLSADAAGWMGAGARHRQGK